MYILLFLMPLFVHAAKLNVPRVLLPYNHGIVSNFTLRVQEGGCFKWTSSRDEVLLEVISERGCSHEAVVSAVAKSPTRLTAIILAKDIGTGFSLRCDVIVDSIHRLEIVTTTRELYAEEAPEEFVVRAYDLYGNEFSTLEGQIFVWDFQTITDHKAVVPAQTVLRFITFEASPYETPPAIGALEAVGEQGCMVLIEGRQTGLARLSVRLTHSSYKNLPPAEVNLMVIANLILEPEDVYILPRTTVQYSVFHLKQGIFHSVEIEGSQYFLHISDDSIAYLEEDGISATGVTIGNTAVTLQDNNVKSSQTLKQPTSSLHVVDPSYLTISIFPHNNPVLIMDNQYTFLVHVYDRNNNKIYLTDSIIINTVVPVDFMKTEFISKNGTYIEGIPFKKGAAKITATLSSIEVSDGFLEISPSLKASLSLDMYDKIRIQPPIVLLPWDYISKPLYKFNLTAEGAHGSVSWSSSNSSLIEVNTLGQCKTKDKGIASVTAALTINPHNNDKAKIYIEEILRMKFLEGILEVEILKNLPLFIKMSTLLERSEIFFTQCYQLPLKLITEENSFNSSDFRESQINNSCVEVDLCSKTCGFSKVLISYQTSKEELHDSVTVGVYKPLRPISPDSGETVLALGTSRFVLFQGGPLPWINKPSNHYAKVEYEESDQITAKLVKRVERKENLDIQAVFVECIEIGEFTITLHVGNKPSSTLPVPVKSSSSIKIVCAHPDSIMLSAVSSRRQGCQDKKDIHTVITHSYKPFPMEVTVKDSEGRKFDNLSSLVIDWSVSEPTLAAFPLEHADLMKTHVHYDFNLPLIAEQNLMPFGLPGDLVVRAAIKGYKYETVKHVLLPTLHDTLRVMLVKDAELIPAELVLFNHPENKGEVLVSAGSGQFQLAKEEEDIASFQYISENNKIIVTPIAEGTTTLTLRDVCLEPRKTRASVIRVSSVGYLELKVRDRVEVGFSVDAEVIATDTFGNHVPFHTLMKIVPYLHSSIINISFKFVNENGNAVFQIDGKTIGDTSLKMGMKKGASTLYSSTRSIQVFPALTIHPRNITLLVGAVFQVETNGGPYPDSIIEYITENETISSVSYAGVITALSLGTSRLTARAVSLHKDGEHILMYSQDSVIIRVIPLESIHIHSPLKYIETGYTMPMYAMGGDSFQNPLSYATVIPPLLFEWSLSNKQIASFKTLYSENGVVESKENQGIIRFIALKPGRASVSLKVTVTVPHTSVDFQISKNIVLTDKIEIKVFESFKLKSPNVEDAKILLAPNSQTRILTNRDSEGRLSYKLKSGNESGSSSVVSVSPEGFVQSGNAIGDASIMVILDEQFGITQTISILVEVRPITYFEIETLAFMKAAGKSLFSALPLGITHELRIKAHDHRGRKFTAINSAFEFRLSRFDLVHLRPGSSNDTLLVVIRNMGQTVLHIWDKNNPLLTDFLKINSGPGIVPDRASVPFGSYVCFSSQLQSSRGEIGTWKSEHSALELEPELGIGVAHQVGKVSVSYHVSSLLTTTTEIYIVPIQKISVRRPSDIVSNIKKNNGTFIEVYFEGDYDGQSSYQCFPHSNLMPNIPFTCIVSFSSSVPQVEAKNIFKATAVYFPSIGFGCLLESTFESDLSFATSGVELMLGVSVIKSGLQEDVQTGMTSIPFFPAAFSEKSEIILTDVDHKVAVIVHGSAELLSSFSVISDDKYLDVQIENVEETKCTLIISAKDAVWTGSFSLDPISLSVVSSLTQQIIKVEINFEKVGSETCPDTGKRIGVLGFMMSVASHYQNALFSILCFVIAIICIILGYYSLVYPGYKQTQNAGVFASSSNLPPSASQGNSNRSQTSTLSTPPAAEALNRRHYPQSPEGISLWSIDQEPVYGEPLFRSSPRPAYEGSPTYARNSSIHN